MAANNLTNQNLPLTQGKAYLVDYNSLTNTFSNWTSFNYPNGPAGITLSPILRESAAPSPGSVVCTPTPRRPDPKSRQGSWVSVRRNTDGTFGTGTWVDLNYPNFPHSVSSNNSGYGDQVVGLVIDPRSKYLSFPGDTKYWFPAIQRNQRQHRQWDQPLRFQWQCGGDELHRHRSRRHNPGFGNKMNGILVTGGSSGNLIGGQVIGTNNPTGSKDPTNAVFQRPPQGNLISGNLAYGVLINGASTGNVLSGNFIGTDAGGTRALGNGQDGVSIVTRATTRSSGPLSFRTPLLITM